MDENQSDQQLQSRKQIKEQEKVNRLRMEAEERTFWMQVYVSAASNVQNKDFPAAWADAGLSEFRKRFRKDEDMKRYGAGEG